MTTDQVNHLQLILNSFYTFAKEKYESGAKAHGGDLLAKNVMELLVEIRDESIDSYIYTQTAIQKVILAQKILDKKPKKGKKKKAV